MGQAVKEVLYIVSINGRESFLPGSFLLIFLEHLAGKRKPPSSKNLSP